MDSQKSKNSYRNITIKCYQIRDERDYVESCYQFGECKYFEGVLAWFFKGQGIKK